MTIRVALNHKTTYQYDRMVSLSPQVVRLRPAAHCRTPINSYSLSVDPANAALISRAAEVDAARAKGQPTVPSTLADELATNRRRVSASQTRTRSLRMDAGAGGEHQNRRTDLVDNLWRKYRQSTTTAEA